MDGALFCPFTANYTAVVLTGNSGHVYYDLGRACFCEDSGPAFRKSFPSRRLIERLCYPTQAWWFLGGLLVVGIGTLVRPETPLLLLALGLVLLFHWRRRSDWSKLCLAVLWMSVGLILPLVPWAARNARTLGRVEFLAPRYAETYGDFIPRGFYSWTQTWMVRFQEAYSVTWKVGKAPIQIDALPDSAFDSGVERVRVAGLLDRYNSNLQMTPLLDREFALLARERTERRPIHTYLAIPLERMCTIWFTPRVELLPYSGDLWPPLYKWRSNHMDFGVTAGFGILKFYLFRLGGDRRMELPQAADAGFFSSAFLAVRTVFLTQLQTVEPRYLIPCFPVSAGYSGRKLAWQ